jgi:uncharacterized membrane protein
MRLSAIDRLRGIVMVLMALDHARDFFGDGRRSPTDLANTTVPLFFTRWITHFCAPVFVLLAGTSAYLMLARGDEKRDVAKFLATRGLWLIFLEVTIIRVAWFFDLTWRFTALQVIWAIGWSMIGLAVLVFLPPRVVGAIGVATIALHNLLDHTPLGPHWLASVLHKSALMQPSPGYRVFVVYPLIPWVAVIAAGFALGEIVHDRKKVLRLGALLTVAFLVVRGINRYGDPHPWSGALHPVLSFLNCEKYPPSLAYLLMTLGPALIALALLDAVQWKPFEVIGRVPLFYYIAHLYLLHTMAFVGAWLIRGQSILGQPFFAGGGVRAGLPGVYLGWLLALAILYPLCVWYAALKARRRDVWLLRYL